jgi:hypothetical protein
MEMLLMALCVSLFGLAVSALAFGAATRGEPDRSEPKPLRLPLQPPQFFLDETAPAPSAPPPQVPVELLLHRLEQHIRLEQAAAESFVSSPTPKSLHGSTTSPLVH